MSEWSNPQSDPFAAAAKRVLDQSVQDLDQKTILLMQRTR